MNNETDNEKLRQDCLAHWRRMLDLSVEDIREGKEAPGRVTCAFCGVYWDADCKCCPIKKATGLPGCEGTPYYRASSLYFNIESRTHRRLSEFRKAVKREIRFLERLEIE